jgi:hypothetical protein
VLLLITGSNDGTSDLLIDKIGHAKVFRFNYDLFNDYNLEFTPSHWRIVNPTGFEINSSIVKTVFWWKAFNFYLLNEDKFIVEEVKYIFREIYHWCRLRGMTRGNPHDFHNHLGKINILSIASNHFKIPKTLTTFNLLGIDRFSGNKVVAKSFSSGLTTTNMSLMTTEVDIDNLHPKFPWYLQEKVISDYDITVFICGKNLFAYQKSRLNLKGLDWRAEQSLDPSIKEWTRFNLTESFAASVSDFCLALNVNWGRIDLMRSNDEMIFLEFNANGQWVFLDFFKEDNLVEYVAEYITS